MQKWIKCDEMLPNKKVKVLLTSGEKLVIGQLGTDRKNPKDLYWFVDGEFPTVVGERYIAWMPLPDPKVQG